MATGVSPWGIARSKVRVVSIARDPCSQVHRTRSHIGTQQGIREGKDLDPPHVRIDHCEQVRIFQVGRQRGHKVDQRVANLAHGTGIDRLWDLVFLLILLRWQARQLLAHWQMSAAAFGQ